MMKKTIVATDAPVATRSSGVRERRRGTSIFETLPREVDDDWLMPYLDITTQLVLLFVLMLSFSHFDGDIGFPDKTLTADALVNIVPLKESPPLEPPAARTPAEQRLLLLRELQALANNAAYDVRYEDHAVLVGLNDDILFPSARASLTTEGAAILEGVLPLVMQGRFEVAVEGHTDDLPISTLQYPSNWELSAARSSTVVRFLVNHGIDADRLRVVAFGATHPRAAGAGEAARTANRRVMLRLMISRNDLAP